MGWKMKKWRMPWSRLSWLRTLLVRVDEMIQGTGPVIVNKEKLAL